MNVRYGAYLQQTGNYAITGSAGFHINARNGGTVEIQGHTITLTGTPAFGTFAIVQLLGVLLASGTTFSGAATGTRYNVQTNAVISTSGGGANYFPGDAAGVTASGGQYV